MIQSIFFLKRWRTESDEQDYVEILNLMMIIFILISSVATYCTVSVSDRQMRFISLMLFHLKQLMVGGGGGLCWGPQQVQSDLRRTQTELQPVSQTTSELRVIFGLMQRQNHKNQRVFPSDILWVLRMALNESLLKRAISLILFPSQIYTPINVQVW